MEEVKEKDIFSLDDLGKSNKNIPIVSVVVPVYNSEKYLEQCISTILDQSLTNFELICVDDCSIDDSRRILEKFAKNDKRITLIYRSSPSGSAAVPRNTGLEIAKGKYVIFLDSDDFFDRELLSKLTEAAVKHDADIVMCDSYNVYEGVEEPSKEHTELHYDHIPDWSFISRKDIPEKIFQISNAAVWHRLFEREFLKKSGIRFQVGVPSLDDIFFANATLAIAERISFVKERLVYYRKGNQGAQTSKIDKHYTSIFYAFKALNDFLHNTGIYSEVKTSLQTWTISTMKWWLASVNAEIAYNKLLELYRNEYISGLDLFPENLSKDLDTYWKKIIEQWIDGTFPYLCSSFLRFYVKKNDRIVIYGAGDEGKKVSEMIEKHGKAELALWVDRNVRGVNDREVFPPENIMDIEHDYVLIAINNPSIAAEVKQWLIDIGEKP